MSPSRHGRMAPVPIQQVRIFVSSSGDCAHERALLDEAFERINRSELDRSGILLRTFARSTMWSRALDRRRKRWSATGTHRRHRSQLVLRLCSESAPSSVLSFAPVRSPHRPSASTRSTSSRPTALLVMSNGKTLLIDAGKNGQGQRIRNAMMQAGVTQIDALVATTMRITSAASTTSSIRACRCWRA
jgi:hypothetical protein